MDLQRLDNRNRSHELDRMLDSAKRASDFLKALAHESRLLILCILAEGEKNGVFKESLEKERVIGLKQRQTFQAAVKAGVKMVFGTDGGVYPNGFNARQFVTMVKWGMTPMQAIQAATANAAEALGRPGDVGAIAVGRYGDLIAVAGNPLDDVAKLQSVGFVMKGGEVVKGL